MGLANTLTEKGTKMGKFKNKFLEKNSFQSEKNKLSTQSSTIFFAFCSIKSRWDLSMLGICHRSTKRTTNRK